MPVNADFPLFPVVSFRYGVLYIILKLVRAHCYCDIRKAAVYSILYRLLQNNGVLKSVSTTRQVSDNTALDTIPANRDFASTGELDPGRTISLN